MDVHRFRMGPFTNAFVIRVDRKALVIDAGFPHHDRLFLRQLERIGMRPREIQLMVATHGHADHVGSLGALREQCPAPVAIHRADSDLLRSGRVVVPPAVTTWGAFLSVAFRVLSFLGKFEPIEPEIILQDECPLDEFGFPGRILATPGHTSGSVSVLLDGGEAFVGDLAVNAFPFGTGLGIPSLGENLEAMYRSWEKLLAAGATMIYPGHGRPFAARHLAERLDRHKARSPAGKAHKTRR